MFNSKSMRLFASGLCSVGLFTSTNFVQAATSATPAVPATAQQSLEESPSLNESQSQTSPLATKVPETRDVQLQADGKLRGQLVTPANASVMQAPVQLWQDGQLIAESKTDAEGNFEIDGVSGGLYQLAAPATFQPVRAWNAGTAPPNANDALLLVADKDAVRGNFGGINDGIFRWEEWYTAVVIGGIITSAIVIQAVRQSEDGS